jgi:hypothetical protein
MDETKRKKKGKPATKAEQDAEYAKLLQSDLDAIWPGWAAARYLDMSEATLADRRRTGDGPHFVRTSKAKVGYRKRALIAYLEAREFASTSAERAAGSSTVVAGGGAGARP